MNRLPRILFLVLLPLVLLSCTREENYTVAAACDGRILVAQDKDTMERLIDCAITGKCEHLAVMELLPSRKVFLVEAGTTVAMKEGLFSFSNARKVHILEGDHHGEDGWVYDRMLSQDRSSVPYQLAFARIYRTSAN